MMIQNPQRAFEKRLEKREILLREARLMVAKLERISADSIWAHRSSGVRGNLLRLVDQIETGIPEAHWNPADLPLDGRHPDALDIDLADLERLIGWSFDLLVNAAKEKIE